MAHYPLENMYSIDIYSIHRQHIDDSSLLIVRRLYLDSHPFNVNLQRMYPHNGREKTGDIQRPRTRPSTGVHRRSEVFLFDDIQYTSEGVRLITHGSHLPTNKRIESEAVEKV